MKTTRVEGTPASQRFAVSVVDLTTTSSVCHGTALVLTFAGTAKNTLPATSAPVSGPLSMRQ